VHPLRQTRSCRALGNRVSSNWIRLVRAGHR